MLTRAHGLLLEVYRRLPVAARRRVVRLVAPTFSVGAICLIERADGAVLLVRHSYRRRWGTPGGLLARGEAAADGARREVREEVGLEVEMVGEPAVVVEPVARRVDLIYRCHPAIGSDTDGVTPGSPEIVEARWFAPSALPELQPETAGAVRAMARAALSPPAIPLLRPADGHR